VLACALPVVPSGFLADRTNGRTIGTVLRLSSSSVTLCIVATVRPRAKVTIDSVSSRI